MGDVLRRDASEAVEAPFLGVFRSAKGFQWRERLVPEMRATAVAIAQRNDIPELLGRVLAARGVGPDAAPAFLAPTIKSLMPDPSSILDMDAAASRIADAIEGRQRQPAPQFPPDLVLVGQQARQRRQRNS